MELPLDKLAAPERFHGFQDLIQNRVQDVLLVATLYDYYILSQDGRLSEQFLGEFLELNLRHTPNLTHAFSGKEAVARALESNRYDLIITSVELGDMNVLGLVAALRAEGRAGFVAYVMAGDPSREQALEILRRHRYPHRTLVVDRDPELTLCQISNQPGELHRCIAGVASENLEKGRIIRDVVIGAPEGDVYPVHVYSEQVRTPAALAGDNDPS